MDSPNWSEMDTKLSIPAPTFLFTVLKNIFPEWKTEKCFLSCENEIKIKNTACMTFTNVANVKIHHSRVHFIKNKINNTSSLVIAIWK